MGRKERHVVGCDGVNYMKGVAVTSLPPRSSFRLLVPSHDMGGVEI